MTSHIAWLFLLPALAFGNPTLQWEELMTKAAELLAQGHFQAASDVYTRAASAALATSTPAISASVTAIAIGKLRFDQGEIEAAEKLWRAELASAEAANLSTVCAVLVHLGEMYTRNRRYRDAETAYTRCLLRSEGNAGQFFVTALTGIGNLHQLERRYKDAAPPLERALALVADGKEDSLDEAVVQYKLAQVYSHLGRNAEADDLFERSLASATRTMGSSDFRLVAPLTAMAEHLGRTGRKQRAKGIRDRVKLLAAQDSRDRRHTINVQSLRSEQMGRP